MVLFTDFWNNFPGSHIYHWKFWDFDTPAEVSDFDAVVSGYTAPSTTQDEEFGVLDLGSGSSTTTDNAYVQLQSKKEIARIRAGKRFRWACRAKLSTATEIDAYLGMIIRDSAGGPVTGYSDGFGFKKDDGDTQWDAFMAYNAVSIPGDYSQDNNIYTATTSYMLFMMDVIPNDSGDAGRIEYYIDGVQRGRIDTQHLPNDEELTVTMAFQNGTTAANNFYIDYIGFGVER